MRKYYTAERLKYRHTFIGKLVLFMPLVSVIFAAWLTHEYFTVDSYNWWYMVLYPGMLAVISGVLGGKDGKRKNVTIGSLPCDVGKIWDAKVLVGAVFSAVSVLCIIFLTVITGKWMELGMHMTFRLQPSVETQILAGVLLWVTTLWQIPFCLWLSQKIGSFFMFIVHMGSCGIISALVSLKPWFAVLPGAITPRLMCPVLGILPNGLLAVEGQETYLPEFMEIQNLFIGIPAAVLWFLIFWLGSRRWFERRVAV